MSSTKRGTLKACAVVLVVFLLLATGLEYKTGIGRDIAYILIISVKESLRRTSFDSAKWKDPKLVNGSDPIRIRMIDDLLNRYKLTGMTKKQVENLLGKPDIKPSADEYYYYLGERGPMKIDPEDLIIKFGPSGTVVEVEIIET